MTGLMVEPRRVSAAPPAGIPRQLEPAFSSATKELARQVDALRRLTPSPTSFEQEPLPDRNLAERLFDALAQLPHFRGQSRRRSMV
jgi:hypothetical protein